jgi:DNA-binding NarL/FixJ family response regulator
MSDPVRILVVEDQFFFRVALRSIVDARGDMVIVGETDNGREAIELQQKLSPDVIIMDLRLPGASGFEVIGAIRRLSPKARILVLSNYEGSEDVYRAMEAGALAYLTKDAEGEELVRAILAVHAGKRYLPAALGALLAGRVGGDELTDRELDVLRLLAQGFSNREIGTRLHIAEKTVKIHVSRVLDKLGVSDRTQAAMSAVQRGIVHLP